ncbi:hypothetical protein V6Z11_A06G051900 [Gossypium hirsutum]
MQKKKKRTQFFRNQLFLKIYERSRMGALVNTWSSIHFLQLNSKVILLLFCMLSLTGSGNHVYVLGGISRTDATFGGYDDVNDVFQLDWKDVERGWRKTTSMLFPRAFPLVFAAEGKIYVFEQLVFESFGEVYNISGDIWEPLSPPLEAIALSNPVLDSSRSRILVHCHVNDSLYAYYYDRNGFASIKNFVTGLT